MSGLFRDEAVAHQSQRFHGTVLLTRTWSYAALTLFFCGLVLAVIVFGLFFGFARTETVSGMLVADHGLIRLAAPQAGVVAIVRVAEGQRVQAGEPMFVLTSERSSTSGDTQAAINDSLTARIAFLRQELAQQDRQSGNKQHELGQRLDNLKANLAELDEQLLFVRRKIQIVREVAVRMGDAAKVGQVSRNEASERAAELVEQEARQSAIGIERLKVQQALAQLSAARTDLPLQTSRDASQLRRNIEELKQQLSENDARRALVVRAWQAGRAAGIVVQPGQQVGADQRLASLLPAGSTIEAELYAPTRAAGFVQPGTEVMLRYDAYPYQKFGLFRGRVREVSLTTIPLGELQRAGAPAPGQATAGSEPVYRIRVALEAQSVRAAGAVHELKPGQLLTATLVLERRTLAEWVVAPLRASAATLETH